MGVEGEVLVALEGHVRVCGVRWERGRGEGHEVLFGQMRTREGGAIGAACYTLLVDTQFCVRIFGTDQFWTFSD